MSEVPVIVRFVVTGHDAAQESMRNAFKAVSDLGCSVWFCSEECLKVSVKDKRFIYVFDEFAGDAFQHLISLGCRIYGPTCILHCLKNSDVLPRLPHPVYCKSMEGVIISCTNISGECRDLLHRRVQWMMGEASKDFHERVTHLLAGQVGSKKYAVAARLGKTIMTPEWVDAVWNDCRLTFTHSSDMAFEKYRCAVFKGFVISVSGMDGEERQHVRNLVEQNGGRYSGEMKVNECTHLVLHTPRGQKYDYAVKWNINIVSVEWLEQSVSAGFSLDEAQFPVKGDKVQSGIRLASATTSTPTNHNEGHMSTFSNVSSIMTTHINDTELSTTRNNESIAIDPLDTIELSSTGQVPFLDGCKIFVDGIVGARLEKVRKIINRGGGTRYNQINESVSHVVVGEITSDAVLQIQNLMSRPHIVGVQWLVDCVKQGSRVHEAKYKCIDLPSLSSSPQNQNRRSLTTANRPTNQHTPKTVRAARNAADFERDNMNSLLSQYHPTSSITGSLGESTLMRAADVGEMDADVTVDIQQQLQQRQSSDAKPSDENDETMEECEEKKEKLFKNLTFVIIGFEADEEVNKFISELVTDNGGVVVARSRRTHQIIDYAVVPVFGCEVQVTVNEIVTNAWLQVCVEEAKLIPTSSLEIYQPISFLADAQPLNGCVLSISGYSGMERDVLLQLSEHLGGICQDYFVKRANKALVPSTHLIVSSAEGSKYLAAKKWKLPAVTKRWLFECARTGRRVPEKKFNVENSLEEILQQTASNVDKSRDSMPSGENGREISSKSSVLLEKSVVLDVSNSLSSREKSNDTNDVPTGVSSVANSASHQLRSVASDISTGDCERTRDRITGSKTNVSELKSSDEVQQSVVTMNTSSDISNNRGKSTSGSTDENHLQPLPVLVKDATTKSIIHNFSKPAKAVLKNQTVENLRQHEAGMMCSPKLPGNIANSGVDTPGKFLEPGKEFHPTFDLMAVMATLESPSMTPRTMQKRNTSLPLEEVFSTNLAIAIKNSNAPQDVSEQSGFSQSQDTSVESCLKKDTAGPLKGVVIAVCKKLSKNQSEYNNIAVSLGADYRWMYDSSCTHFIFQGRLNDVNKEFRVARDQGKFVVSPHWLTACQDQQCRVDESIYPHTYNPTMSLSITGHTTPARPTRSSMRVAVNSPKKSAIRGSVAGATSSVVSAAAPSVSNTAITTAVAASSPAAENKCLSGSNSKEEDAAFESINTTQSDEDIAMACGKLEEDQDKTANTEIIVDNLKRIMKASKNSKTRAAVNRHHGDSPTDIQRKLSSDFVNGRDNGAAERSRHSKDHPKLNSRQLAKSAADHLTQPSQIVEVVWDDPIAREQREMLASELEKDSESPVRKVVQSTQITTTNKKTTVNFSSKVILENPTSRVNEDSFSVMSKDDAELKHAGITVNDASTTRTSLTKSSTEPQPAAAASVATLNRQKPSATRSSLKPYFLFSGLPQNEKDSYALIVENLGGILLDAANYTPQCTHLIVGTPTRNEKFLSCVAAGKWVLHKSYLDQARIIGDFPSEELYEWGSRGTESVVAALPEQFTKLARASCRWRLKLSALNKGAFDGWRTLLLTESKREDGFKRLLEAGGATVLANKCISDYSGVTHAFLDLSKFKEQVNLEAMVSAGVHCVKPDYIAVFLTDDPPPEANLHYIPEALPFIRVEETRKRKLDSRSSEVDTKRLRPS